MVERPKDILHRIGHKMNENTKDIGKATDFTEDQVKSLEADVTEIYKIFYDTTNMAKSYIKDQLKLGSSTLAKK